MGWIPSEKEAFELLKKENASESVINHCKAVLALVKKFIKDLDVDRDVVIAGTILHDIGRSRGHGVKHGVVGGEILKKHKVDEKIIGIVEKHVGVGIPKQEAVKLGLGDKDLIPQTLEEKIVCYADKLLIGTYVATQEEAIHDARKKLGNNHPAIKRMKKFFLEMKKVVGEK